MDASTTAAFIALGLCIPIVVAGIAARVLFWRDRSQGGDGGDRRGTRLPPRNPYRLP